MMEKLKDLIARNNGAMCFDENFKNIEEDDEKWHIFIDDQSNILKKIQKEGFCIVVFQVRFKNFATRRLLNYIFGQCDLFPVWKNSESFECILSQNFLRTPPKQLFCEQCSKSIKNERGLKRHMKLFHNSIVVHHRTPAASSTPPTC